MTNETFELDFEDEARFISRRTGIAFDTVMEYLEAEDDYCDDMGLNYYGDEDDMSEDEDAPTLNVDDLNRYVTEVTDITIEQADKIAQAEAQYFYLVGISCPC